jgi:hypothetical protein
MSGWRSDTKALEQLTAILAERILGWSAGPDRFLTGKRGWLPRWRFRPAENLNDAFRLLEAATPDGYTMGSAKDGLCWARVLISGVVGEAHQPSQARAITFAIAHALGIEVDSPE